MRIYGPMVIYSVHSAQKSQVKSERYLGLGPFIMQPGWLWFTLLVYNIFHLIIYCKFYQEGLHTVSNEIFVKKILSHSPTKTVTSNYQIHFLGPKKIGAEFLIFGAVTVPTLFLVIKLPCEFHSVKSLFPRNWLERESHNALLFCTCVWLFLNMWGISTSKKWDPPNRSQAPTRLAMQPSQEREYALRSSRGERGSDD